MSRTRWIVSGLLLYHVLAIAVDAIPVPSELREVKDVRESNAAGDAARLTAVADRAAIWLSAIHPTLFAWSQPVRRLTQPYINAGLRQYWAMFSNLLAEGQHVRLDYHVVSGDGGNRQLFRELVLPAGREDRIRWRLENRDKAVINAIMNYFGKLPPRTNNASRSASAGTPEALPQDLLPVVRYFRNRLARSYLRPDQQVTRTDLWYGATRIPASGDHRGDGINDRLDVLARYHEGPAPVLTLGSRDPVYATVEREADIVWTLEYIEGS